MEWHQRSPKGNSKIRDMIARYFHPPKDFDSALWLSQILQAYGIKLGAEYWRQNMPRSMGCIFWQYNDCWPVASWSSVDYHGRWKALHYLARRFYSPVLISGLEDVKNDTIDLFVTSDRLDARRGSLTWEVTDPDGNLLLKDTIDLDVPARTSRRIKTLDLHESKANAGSNAVMTWLKLTVDDQTVSENLVLLVPPKELKLIDPRLQNVVTRAPKGFLVDVRAQRPALWTWLELHGDPEARYSDNFVHLAANKPAQILVQPSRAMAVSEFRKALRLHSLFDTL
jgi:beta-mannosidase